MVLPVARERIDDQPAAVVYRILTAARRNRPAGLPIRRRAVTGAPAGAVHARAASRLTASIA